MLRLLAKKECCDGADCPAIYVDDTTGEVVFQGDRLGSSVVGGLTPDLVRRAVAALGVSGPTRG